MMHESTSSQRVSRRRLVVAFGVAVLADALSILFLLATPVQWIVDLVTAISLFLILGRNWILLPGLIAEAIPGLYVFPFWVLVVAAIATGRITRTRREVGGPKP